ncbi:F-BAR domain only protein 2 isoform X2 [Condylostylus longicornis]|uniref:F-BAR domain only protein 2 isoform X2 n=1 Tax=Condylostylus longicornis TaxID=2530218 RepID=UPI00244DEB6F|nr:F-BAR domain only protein 2 isoform X2 [Condylostylus longicornis]
MTVDFNDYFWGEKNNGYDVLYHNMKFGFVASKELSDFFREKTNVEEQNSKLMTKLAHKAGSGTLNGTFAPIWGILKSSAERLSNLHLQMVQKLSELVKDISKYADELHKKHKLVKDEESSTLEAVQAMQSSTQAVQKSKDLYTNKMQELEKLRKENGTSKDIEKVETKLKKLQDDYKNLMDKHAPIKLEFENKMTATCRRFQEIEEAHLRQMREFLSTYLELVQTNHDMVGQVHSEFKRQFLDMSVDKLLEQFVLNKYTGLEKPEITELELINLSSAPSSSTTPVVSSLHSSNQTHSNTSFVNQLSQVNQLHHQQQSHQSVHSTGAAGSVSGATNALVSPVPSVTSQQKVLGTSGGGGPGSRGVSPEPNSVTSTVRANLRNWFSSNIPSKHSEKPNAAITNTNLNQDNTTSNVSGNGAFNSEGNPNQLQQQHTNQQQNQDTIQSSYISPALSQLSEHNISFSSTNTVPKKGQQQNEQQQQTSKVSSQLHQQHQQQQQSTQHQQQTSSPQVQQPIQQTKSSRRTTSLLNLFMSNSQGSRESREQVEALSAPTSPNEQGLSNQNISQIGRNPLLRGSKFSGILRSRRDKAKTKKSKKKKDTETSSNKDENIIIDEKSDQKNNENSPVQTPATTTANVNFTNSNTATSGIAPTATPEVDEDGYSIKPRNKETSWNDEREKGNFYSSSDSDSDNDKPERKIHVEIKPLNNGTAPISASVDELRATVGNISLSPIGVLSNRGGSTSDNHEMKRSQSVSQKLGEKPSIDLLGLTLFHQQHSQHLQSTHSNNSYQQQSPGASNASTPTTVHPYAPLQSPTLSVSNNSRYADLGDIFSTEIGEISASAPASATLSKASSRQIPTPTSASSIAIPRPPSRRSEAAIRGRVSPSSMSRADSVGSMEFRTAVGIGSSRGPSPLTIGMTDTIPLAVAFHEIIHAYFRGSDESRCQVKMSGDMMLSFPAGIVSILANNPNPAKLGFRIKHTQNLENLIPNKQLVQIDKLQSTSFSTMLEFDMNALTALLRRQSEQNPNASYFNVDILKYMIKSKLGASSCPFQLVSYWKCEPTHTALKIDYKYNSHAMASPSSLLNLIISVPVDGDVKNVQSKPHSVWLGESNRLVWNFTDISQHSEGNGIGTLRARLEVRNGPSTPSTLTVQFNCEGTTLSGIEFELVGTGYRLSLVKRRFVAGKYICEGDGIRNITTPTPPTSVGSPYSAKSN